MSVDAAFEAALSGVMLDGVVLARKIGVGVLRRAVLVAPGFRADGKKKVIDFSLVVRESAVQWKRFLDGLIALGSAGDRPRPKLFSDRATMGRILFAIFNCENRNQGSAPRSGRCKPFDVTGTTGVRAHQWFLPRC